jgi:hypothetical protein
MKKITALKIVNSLIAILFITQAVTGIARSLLPDIAGEIHQYAGYLFSVSAIAHVALNWNWIRATFLKKSQGKRPVSA